jgi:hypothetical protein
VGKAILATLALCAAACSPGEQRLAPEDSAAAAAAAARDREREAVTPPGENAPRPSTPASTPDEPAGKWDVTATGIGQIRAGMSLDEANVVLGNSLVIPAKLEECDYVRVKNAPAGLLLMVEKGKISRVDVTDGTSIATTAGARINDPEERIKSLYPGQVTVQPHKYTDGHYLVVTPKDPAQKDYRIVFETDGQKVTRFRSGRVPSVEYVEGCS